MMVEEIVKYIVIATILLVAANYLGKVFTSIKDFLNAKYDEYKFKKQAQKYVKIKEEEQKKSVPQIYFGLFQFIFENCDDEENIKKEYCAIIKEKLKSKYKNIDFRINATDKVFFNSRDFSQIDYIVEDFIKLYNFFENINKKRNIKTSLKFSLWTKSENINTQKAFKVLSEMNELDYINQVIANEEMYRQYKKEGLNMFDFHPMGVIKLVENDEDFELFRLLKSSVAKSDNK